MRESETTAQFLAGGGEMGEMIRSMDWSKTPLGPIESWPQSLRTSVSLCLSSTFPILIAWGPETIQLYNDSYRPICGAKHPESMGQNFRICWETALPVVGDAFTRGQQGEGTYIKDQRMFLDRYGYLEEAFMTFSFAPIRDESGGVGGIFHPITETTDKMLSARRTQVLRDVAALTGQAKRNEDIYTSMTTAKADLALDLPYLLFYELAPDGKRATLVESVGLTVEKSQLPGSDILEVTDEDWLKDPNETLILENLADRVGAYFEGPYPERPHTAVRLPVLLSTREHASGFMLAGVSPRRALDQDYLNFYALLANTFNTAFSNVYAYQEEQKKAEALAAIDEAKTAFFSNISHEFRTPLTLMLGPLEELLQDTALQQSTFKAPVEATHRNALRLLKLVNNLLDFSRIEAGRVKASFRPVDLVALTTDLASSFRSLIERAGLQFNVNCQPIDAVLYADVEMWEKIVLNLLSNAFKYTWRGQIDVELKAEKGGATLRVSDTGVGIPKRELPHMFERFHRVENAGGRTYEGSGIGLSLVHELVRLHGGTVTVDSEEGVGSVFTLFIPAGKAHLPASQVKDDEQGVRNSVLAESFLQEARTMLAEGVPPQPDPDLPVLPEGEREDITILVADDNSDMRAYLSRLLSPFFTVRTALNGADAIRQLDKGLPQLILSDIMMPVMDGKELLQQVKSNPATAHIPVIFLSARAGQEARIDGLNAGADDYLVKPFSGPELLTKVRAQINLDQSRRQAEKRLRNLVQQAPVAMLLMKGEDLTIELVNQAMLELLQREGDVLGKPLLEALPELEGQTFFNRCREVYRTGITDQGLAVEIPVLRHGNVETGYFNVLLTPYYEGSQLTGVLEVCTEVTQQVQVSQALAISENRYRALSSELEGQVQQRTAELQASIIGLQRSNKNLQQFAYIASHDLQEPLRKVQSFGDLLQRHYADQLADEGIDHLRRIQKAASRMSTLIRDLLAFSRISTQPEITTSVSLAKLVDSVRGDLEIQIRETRAQIRVNEMPTVTGDFSQLSQLMQNLISNAIKFSSVDSDGGTVAPFVEISAAVVAAADLPPQVSPSRKVPYYHRIDVRDEGIGFDEKYLDRIFQIFQRLHGKSQFAGTGIGLAICEKVVANHGGALTASSQPGQGATFSVFLPF
jgi:signal transduction histidine kinase/DNA-binding response OmpR family regulator